MNLHLVPYSAIERVWNNVVEHKHTLSVVLTGVVRWPWKKIVNTK